MLGGLTVRRFLKLASSDFDYVRGVAEIGVEPLDIRVRGRTGLPEALAFALHAGQSIVVVESFARQLRIEGCLSLHCLRAERGGLVAQHALDVSGSRSDL